MEDAHPTVSGVSKGEREEDEIPAKAFRKHNRLQRIKELKVQQVRPRHFAIVFLLLYIIFECIVVGGSITPGTRGTYVMELKYISEDNTVFFQQDSISELQVRVGYFSSCLKSYSDNGNSGWECGNNELRIIYNKDNFNRNSTANIDLLNFVSETSVKFREDCLSPYVLIVSIILSFLSIFLFAFVSPSSNPKFYKFSTVVIYLAFSLALVGAVWQETNVLTGSKLMGVMEDDYYRLETHSGITARVLVWFGVSLLIASCVSLAALSIIGELVRSTQDELEIEATKTTNTEVLERP
ncbi:Fig1 domain-containing protein ASCRUDRAFT_119594 [Ascoidea rubescens DSM 1968]|uniref:Uncharacterized protein n=1 Tax=Ascoidea rubescens DSM 1968 TaxID=1344418 RepID=A0A1D2VAB0_9ASCO|nr:hypothetical protein ASCRUDRAFT_119594 [Ascoidea rubescens DSM 1968]ODV58529.1 hypothetical protein ASCRUDRAFT_119594 [Ascoidea rubescens DSM 1968]